MVQQLSRKCAPSSLKKRLFADGSYEELPLTAPVDTDANELVPLTVEETDGFAPAARAGKRYNLWANTAAQQHHFLREVAEGKITLDEFVALLFSLTSAPPASPTRSTSSAFHEHASCVAQGHAVVYTLHSGAMRRPAGPSAVITLGTP